MRSELRKDYIQEKYVIIAPRRATRPRDVVKIAEEHTRKAKVCAFCPEHPDHPAGLYCEFEKNGGLWQIKVAANKYPAVSLDNDKAYGTQEVVIETKSHFHDLEQLAESHIAKLLLVYAHRTVAITKNNKIEYVLIFKNQGGKAGASLEHAHSQIFATNFIPPQLIEKSLRAQEYKLKHGSCVYCDTIKKEQEGERLIYKDEYVIAFCPFASMYNYEVWIMPMRHLDNITLLSDDERLAWAVILKKVLSKIVLLGLDYNFYFHQVVNDEDQHFYMKVTPRGSTWAGVEIGSGVVINPVSPEDAADYFVLPK